MTGNPLYDPYQILMKVYAEKAYLKQAIADTYIEEAYRSRTVKAAYGVLENDAYLSFCISYLFTASNIAAITSVSTTTSPASYPSANTAS